MKSINLVTAGILWIALMWFSSCDLIGGGSGSSATEPLGGDPTPMGSVGNTFSFSGISGVSNESAEVMTNDGAVSTIQMTATVTDPALLQMAEELGSLDVNGNQVTGSMKFRITSQGLQSYTKDGKPFTIVKYSAKVGDTYRLKRSSSDLVRKVSHVSTDDDYQWGFLYIKTVQVEETGQIMPGISKITYVANHRFGLVGYIIDFEDGSQKSVNVYSNLYNE